MISHFMSLQIDKEALLNNYNYLKNISNKNIIPVLKSNGYGMGADILTKILHSFGQKLFAVARYSEAHHILSSSKLDDIQILVFESIRETPFFTDSKNIIFSANSFDDLKLLLNNNVLPIQIHIKLDLGFGRNGIIQKDFTKLYNYILENKYTFGGIYTHLFSVSKGDQKELINQFKSIITLIGKDKFSAIHIISSESFYNTDTFYIDNYLRIGQLLYGIQEPNNINENLKKVFKLTGRIENIKDIKENKHIGYQEKRKIKHLNHSNVAIVKFGYGDGFLKYNENTTCLIKGIEYYISSVCMDYTFINVDNRVNVGDEIEFYFDTNKFYKDFNKKIYEFLPSLSSNIVRMVK